MLLLGINTATKVLSLSLTENDKLISSIELRERQSHAKLIIDKIDELLKNQTINYNNLDGVVINLGPGSFTGLRVGMSTAKGLTFNGKVKLFACNIFEEIIENSRRNFLKQGKVSILIESRKEEFYFGKFNFDEKTYFNEQINLLNLNNIFENVKASDIVFIEKGTKYFDYLSTKMNNIIEIEANVYYSNLFVLKNQDKTLIQDIDLLEPLYINEFFRKK